MLSRLRHGESGLVGLYANKQSALRHATGYDTSAIFDRVTVATEAAVKSRGHLFDRDSVIFDHPITPFPLLTCLLRAAHLNDNIAVIDFGGAFGSTYRQCKPFLSHFNSVRWHVVEQDHIVARGRERYSSDSLSFFGNIAEAAFGNPPDAIIFSSVLQYLDDPYSILAQAISLSPRGLIIDRTPNSDRVEDVFSVEVVPRSVYSARLAFRIFGARAIETELSPDYRKFAEFDAIDPGTTVEGVSVRFHGMYFEPQVLPRAR
jgi:putative methyltransferase (TIGR04325 family)